MTVRFSDWLAQMKLQRSAKTSDEANDGFNGLCKTCFKVRLGMIRNFRGGCCARSLCNSIFSISFRLPPDHRNNFHSSVHSAGPALVA